MVSARDLASSKPRTNQSPQYAAGGRRTPLSGRRWAQRYVSKGEM